jgi:hypothetical protein
MIGARPVGRTIKLSTGGQMLSAIAGWIIVLLFVVFVWRFVARL